ncbi:MAG: hypothetical protein K2J84_00985, partial [Bacteroidaceae bacterium]|nr:hypothetical protein [Bacteroidaceae bacterium]
MKSQTARQEKGGQTKTKKASEESLKPSLLVGIPGLEPGISRPESVVLPNTPNPNFVVATLGKTLPFQNCDTKVVLFG